MLADSFNQEYEIADEAAYPGFSLVFKSQGSGVGIVAKYVDDDGTMQIATNLNREEAKALRDFLSTILN